MQATRYPPDELRRKAQFVLHALHMLNSAGAAHVITVLAQRTGTTQQQAYERIRQISVDGGYTT